MYLPLSAKTCSPTFYLYRRTYIQSHNVNIFVYLKTLNLLWIYYEIKWYKLCQGIISFIWRDITWGYPGNPYSLKATSYTGYNLSIQTYIMVKILKPFFSPSSCYFPSLFCYPLSKVFKGVSLDMRIPSLSLFCP